MKEQLIMVVIDIKWEDKPKEIQQKVFIQKNKKNENYYYMYTIRINIL